METWKPVALGLLAAALGAAQPSVDFRHGDLKVAENRRFLVHADGTPFFYLGDTAWELFHRLNREQTERYLENRRQKRFTVIQAVVLAELDGLNTPNAAGDRPLIDNDPTRPNEAYFRHVDWVVERAREKGLFIGMLPTWGDKVVKASWGVGPLVFNPENARAYGRFLEQRYRDHVNLIWILGGDRNPNGFEAIWRAMAEGLREGDGGRHLITYHPSGRRSSSEWLHAEPWLDFNMMQSGHNERDGANYEMIAHDYRLSPVKPTFDGEPRYENHPVDWKPKEKGWFDEYDVRQAAYWGVFAGGHGHTYGCHDIWQMLAPGREPVGFARGTWYGSLDLPGAGQMRHIRALMESRPFLSRVPDHAILAGEPGRGPDHVEATRGDGYVFVYLPAGRPVSLKLGPRTIPGDIVIAWWYDPRTGAATRIGPFENQGVKSFQPPGSAGRGNDWVLVLDERTRGYPPPGTPLAPAPAGSTYRR
jgi:hypothetical protein